jgi:D-alanyl-D-alanine carboxypeptidase
MLKKVSLQMLLILSLMLNIDACSKSNLPLSEQLQAVLDKKLKDYDVKGVSAAIIMPNGEIWRGVSGFSHDSVKISPDMLFAIGSITKNMVATLTLQLVEEGVLTLEDSLDKWLPGYRYVDSTITIRQLLNHTSGLYMFWENQKIWDDFKKYRTKIFTTEEVLSYIKEPYFQPGKGHRYSNTNYLLMAMIITKATGSTLAAEFRKRFWEPLGIQNAYVSMEEELPTNLAHVWGDNFENDGSMRDLTFLPRESHESITFGSAGLFMTAEDLARWSQALFQGKLLSEASMAEMLTFVKSGGYGLGIGRFGGFFTHWKTAFGHGGGNIGTIAYMIYLPDYNISIAAMINKFDDECLRSTVKDLIGVVTGHLAQK